MYSSLNEFMFSTIFQIISLTFLFAFIIFCNEFHALGCMQEDLTASKNLCVYGLKVFIAIIVPS